MAGLTIGIVEDVPEMALWMQRLLLATGNPQSGAPQIGRVWVAATVAEARAELLKHRPDLLLLDRVLPGESGLVLVPELEIQGVAWAVLAVDSPDSGPEMSPENGPKRQTVIKPGGGEDPSGGRFVESVGKLLAP